MSSQDIPVQHGPRETRAVDVLIVGAGPAGLACAIHLKQMAAFDGQPLSVLVLEKGAAPGAHILSGAVMDPRALKELFPDWRERGAPLHQRVSADDVLVLSAQDARRLPDVLIPDNLHNGGNYVVSLGAVTQWLAQQAQQLGVEIRAGCAAAELLYGEDGSLRGVVTGDVGRGRDGRPREGFTRGTELRARYTVLAEGSRGQLGKQVIARYRLDAGRDPQHYALGIKELWAIAPAKARPGRVVHTTGWPLDTLAHGGGFLYHLENHRVALGLVTALDYRNPWLSPFEEMQRWKTHPAIRRHLEGGQRIGYGARTLTTGGLLSLPKLVFPGGALVGCEAGTLNAARLKGSHAALKSGMLCADALYAAVVKEDRRHDELTAYPEALRASWLWDELDAARNFGPWFQKGPRIGRLMTGVEHWLLPRLGLRRAPWTIHHAAPDPARLSLARDCTPITYPPPDGVISFDRASSVRLSHTRHEENQPTHLTLIDAKVPLTINLAQYAGPEARYCPAGVYEFVKDDQGRDQLRINARHCLHCKACDIKDPTQNIVWVSPEGGSGPNYSGL